MIKTEQQIEKMRIAGKLAASVLTMIENHIKPGVTTETLDLLCHNYIVDELCAVPAALNYKGFPKSVCISVNHQVCHAIPNNKVLKKGDIVNVDVAVIKDEYHGDTSKMFFVGEPSVLARRLVNVTYQAMIEGIKVVRPGNTVGDIGYTIQQFMKQYPFSIVREYCGHGIGTRFHEDPIIPHVGTPHTGVMFEPGMTFTIEPIINAGSQEVKLLLDKWTVVTKDHSLSAQWEHTILVTDNGYEVLTLRPGEHI